MQFGASGLAAVWAENNTREAIFSSLKEDLWNSGNKILLRFFAGYDLEQGDLNSKRSNIYLLQKRCTYGF